MASRCCMPNGVRIPAEVDSPAVDAPEMIASALDVFRHAAEAGADGRDRAAGRKSLVRRAGGHPGEVSWSVMPSQGRCAGLAAAPYM